ncbi:hypothetical protein B0H13DRAFT_2440743 [Mycena leptocephala]|nr:hypothetical protein B0H13DRAFT_2440743 [Mycena leptocephala]
MTFNHTSREDTMPLVPAAMHIVPTPLQVSSQRLPEERDTQLSMRLSITTPQAFAPVRRENGCAEFRALHLLAVPLLLEHTDPHSTAHTAVPISAPPAYTPPAQLGLAPSRPPPMRIVSICRLMTLPRKASAAPPSYPPAPYPASSQADIKQHAHAHITTCAPHAAKMARAKRGVQSQRYPHTHGDCQPASATKAPCTGHPPQTSARIPVAPRIPDARRAGIKGPRTEETKKDKEEKMERKAAHPIHPEQLLQQLKYIHCETRDGDAHARDTDVRAQRRRRVVTMPASDTRARRRCSGPKSEFLSVCERGRAAGRRDIDRGRVEREDVEEAKTAGQISTAGPLQALKRACVPRSKVGGHRHKEGELHPPARRFLISGHWDPATHVRQSWPILCAGDTDCHGHRMWLHVERGEREKEEGEEVKNTHDAHKYPE